MKKSIFTGLAIILVPSLFLVLMPDKKQLKDSIGLQSKKLRFFDWEHRGDIDLAGIYSEIKFLPTSEGKVSDDVKICSKNIFVHDFFKEDNVLRIYDINNPLQPLLVDLSRVTTSPVSLVVDEKSSTILVGDSGNKRVLKINYQGEILEEYYTGFYFMGFNYSKEEGKFIFYAITETLGAEARDRNAIFVTNRKMEILQRSFPVDVDLLRKLPIRANSFKTLGERTFFNPPLTGDIYELFYDGSYKKVFGLPEQSEKESYSAITSMIKNIKQVDSRNYFELNEILPVVDYLVGENEIIVERYFNGVRYNVIVETATGRAIVISPRRPTNNFGKQYLFAFKTPKFVNDLGFVAQISNNECNVVNKSLTVDQVPDYLKEAVKSQHGLFMIHRYNFDFLYNHSKEDLTPLIQGRNNLAAQDAPLITELKTFPNPADERLTIQFNHASSSEATIDLINVWGTIIDHKKVTSGNGFFSIEFNLTNLTPGNYFVAVRPAKGLGQTIQVTVK